MHDASIHWPYSPFRALASSSSGSVTAVFYGVGLLASCRTPNLEDQVSVFMAPGDRVAQLYPRALGSSGTSGRHSLYPLLWAPDGIVHYSNDYL
jgi:hypothetical protein